MKAGLTSATVLNGFYKILDSPQIINNFTDRRDALRPFLIYFDKVLGSPQI